MMTSEEEDTPKVTFVERFRGLMAGERQHVTYFTRLYAAPPDIFSGMSTIEQFWSILGCMLMQGSEEQYCDANWSIYKLVKHDLIPIDWFIRPEVLGRICRGITFDGVAVKHVSIRAIIELVMRKPDILVMVCGFGFLDNLWGIMMEPDSSPALENDRVFRESLEDVCFVCNSVVGVAGAENCVAQLWTLALRLLRVEHGLAVRTCLYVLADIMEMNVACPDFDEESLQLLANVGAGGESALRALFTFLGSVNDEGKLWKDLCERNLLNHLLEHVEYCEEDSFLIYRFFSDISFAPTSPSRFIEYTYTFMTSVEASHRVKMDIIGYFAAVFQGIDSTVALSLIERGMMEHVADALCISGGSDACILITAIVTKWVSCRRRILDIPGISAVRDELVRLVDGVECTEEVDSLLREIDKGMQSGLAE